MVFLNRRCGVWEGLFGLKIGLGLLILFGVCVFGIDELQQFCIGFGALDGIEGMLWYCRWCVLVRDFWVVLFN